MPAFWSATALLPGGWAQDVRFTVVDGRIASVDTDTAAAPGDELHRITLPGLANVHSHAFQRGMAGLAEHRGGTSDDNFWSWREVMYRFLDRLAPDDMEAIAAMAYAEMLETGYTHVGEFHYLHNDADGRPYRDPAEMAARIAAAARTTGIGLTLLPVFYAHSNFGGQAPNHSQRRFIHDLDSFSRMLEACRPLLADGDRLGIAPHSLRAVTPDELAALIDMPPQGPIHIHAAEQQQEVGDCLAWSGQRPVEWLLDHAAPDARWCLIHATHLSDAETDALAASGAVAGLCPITEANLGDGIFPASRFLAAGGRIGTGTDSNILIDPAQELRALEYSQRLAHQARNVLASEAHPSVARRLFADTLAGGAQAMAIEPGLAVGHAADFVTLDAAHPALHGRTGDQLLDGWIFAARNSCIDTVWKRGKQLVAGGRHKDGAQVTARYLKVVDRIMAR
ncbi:formimidoylglutamate deiminase [Novosphingobium lentum]|uniref:formimidoylglutamate deiminase n=1 Tax=Novosphingobium lentum TaxID=145287 RepID=UPI000832AC01|nr:formimidoylglutamate deiminase [Novosphingobium lentum]